MGGVVTRFVGRRAGCTTSVCLTVMPSYANFGTSNPTKSVKLWGFLFFSSSLVCLLLSFFEGEVFVALKNVFKSTKPCLFLCIVEAAYFEFFFYLKIGLLKMLIIHQSLGAHTEETAWKIHPCTVMCSNRWFVNATNMFVEIKRSGREDKFMVLETFDKKLY